MRKTECESDECPFCGCTVVFYVRTLGHGKVVDFWYNIKEYYFSITMKGCIDCIKSILTNGTYKNNQGLTVVATDAQKLDIFEVIHKESDCRQKAGLYQHK